jgi:hypothetical protein
MSAVVVLNRVAILPNLAADTHTAANCLQSPANIESVK